MEDEKLIKRCQAGDKEAFQVLIRKYHPFVYRFLSGVTQNKDTAEDLVQETFIKIIRNIDRFDVDGSAKFSTYIIAVSKNCYIDYLRREKKLIMSTPADENTDIEDISIDVEETVLDKMEGERVAQSIEKLTEEQSIVIKMRYIEELTLKEIGDALGIETKTVKSRLHNGIVKLRKMLGGSE